MAKKWLLALVSLLATLGAVGLFALWLAWECGIFPDYGLESGYYGQFNRVRHVLETMPGVRITNSWQHRDVTLEDFGFYLLVKGSQSVRVDFQEGTPQMKEREKQRIREYVEAEINRQLRNPPADDP